MNLAPTCACLMEPEGRKINAFVHGSLAGLSIPGRSCLSRDSSFGKCQGLSDHLEVCTAISGASCLEESIISGEQCDGEVSRYLHKFLDHYMCGSAFEPNIDYCHTS